ncbi:glycoside hydrolase family 13 protein [Pseudokineococcus lusitanus]|uniref:Alpha-glucosidase n=1 Tax=Pseudokineococcus lusitanus TaxID=763993 RepID=A0A3N1HTV2_9ACTN|nr:glycoside hydrolase family 13 protein [Pseudokineococcus lusitanus]ROP45897.1 alpha-glucosidase [Pseudokineococcus lusitanus]
MSSTPSPGPSTTTDADVPDLLAVPATSDPDARSPWWRSAVIYQVYPRSFADGDGDGIGDLPGITARLPHLVELGVDALWLSPFYTSPQHDAGYDVADYRDVDPRFGTLADADALVARAHELGLRVVVDLVPNHTSWDHAWFRAALASAPGSRERGRYLFRDGRGEHGELPPTSWRSVFGGPAWTRVTEPDGTPGQWYLHLFDVSQPDLDWSSSEVVEEFHDVLRFWLDRGVDGFRVDVAHGLVKADGLPEWDAALEMISGSLAGEGEARTPPPMWDQEGVHEIYRGWRKVLDDYDGDRMLVAEAWVQPLSRLARYVRADEMQQAFNFAYLVSPLRAQDLRDAVDATRAALDAVGAPATWVLSNHDVVRHATRLGLSTDGGNPDGLSTSDPQPDAATGLRRARAATLLMLALPGGAYLYQGEELGLPDVAVPDDARQDPTWERSEHAVNGRDGCRVPIPWEKDAPSFGFGPTDASWLPQPAVYGELALDQQRDVPGSTYEMYRAALRLRRELALGTADDLAWTDLDGAARVEDGVLAARTGAAVVVANLGEQDVVLPTGAEVLLVSGDLGADATDPGRRLLPPMTTAWLRGA